MRRILCLFATLLLLSVGFSGAEQIMPRPPRPVGSGELGRWIQDTRVGKGERYENLAVFPLFTPGRGGQGYWTLDRAVAKGLLLITEKGHGTVPRLLVENRADQPVFLLAGEIIKGGKQNRVISQDVLLPPRSGLIDLGVYCVEQGRWAQETRYFAAESDMAHGRLREQLSAPTVSQDAVWEEVARKSAAVGVAGGGTRYLGRIFDDEEIKRAVEDYARGITLPGDANGMAILIGDQIVGVEIFGDTETFGSLRDKLLRSYAIDAIERPSRDRPPEAPPLIERFLRRAEAARLVPEPTIGIGRFLKIEAGGLYGSVLHWHGQAAANGLVHTSIFPEG